MGGGRGLQSFGQLGLEGFKGGSFGHIPIQAGLVDYGIQKKYHRGGEKCHRTGEKDNNLRV